MDLSKLPKLSSSQEPPPAESVSLESIPDPPHAASPKIDYRPATQNASIAGDVWFNAIIGLVLIGLGFNFARFLSAKLTGHEYHTQVTWAQGPKEGMEVPYFELDNFVAWTDTGVFLFGAVLLLEAAAGAACALKPGPFSKTVLLFAFALTLGCTTLNAYVCLRLFGAGTTPLLSGLAVAFGGWILSSEWRLLKSQ